MMHYWVQPYTTRGWGYGFGGGLDIILTVAFWALLIFLILLLLFKAFGKDHHRNHDHDWKKDHEGRHKNEDWEMDESRGALYILKMRYVKGEITKKEYEEMKKVIS